MKKARYVLTAAGAAFLAARDGASLQIYLMEGVIMADVGAASITGRSVRGRYAPTPGRLTHLRRHPEHTIGVQRFALALSREATHQRSLGRDCRLLAWLNDAEGQLWFRHEGRTHHIWPDARFRYRADGVVYDLLLEWDRGLVRRREYSRKLAAYAAYFAARPEASRGVPRLIVVTTAAAKERLRDVLDPLRARCPALGEVARVITVDAPDRHRMLRMLGSQPRPTLS